MISVKESSALAGRPCTQSSFGRPRSSVAIHSLDLMALAAPFIRELLPVNNELGDAVVVGAHLRVGRISQAEEGAPAFVVSDGRGVFDAVLPEGVEINIEAPLEVFRLIQHPFDHTPSPTPSRAPWQRRTPHPTGCRGVPSERNGWVAARLRRNPTNASWPVCL